MFGCCIKMKPGEASCCETDGKEHELRAEPQQPRKPQLPGRALQCVVHPVSFMLNADRTICP